MGEEDYFRTFAFVVSTVIEIKLLATKGLV